MVTKARKQIWGWGTPGVNPRTGDALRAQLCGQPASPVVPEVTFADVQADLHQRWPPCALRSNIEQLMLWAGLRILSTPWLSMHSLAPLFVTWSSGMCVTYIIWRHLCASYSTSKAVPLFKNGHGQLRPISMPSVWRKAGSSWVQKSYQPEIVAALRHEQYGAGRSNGVPTLIQDLEDTSLRHPTWCHVQADVSNAFTSCSRQMTYSALVRAHPALAFSQQSRLSPLTEAAGAQAWCLAGDGIAQGDPLSTPVFGILLSSLLSLLYDATKELQLIQGQDYVVRAYIDDVLFPGEPEVIARLLPIWKILSMLLA